MKLSECQHPVVGVDVFGTSGVGWWKDTRPVLSEEISEQASLNAG